MGGFRTKARAVDLLGDEQIKDEATAISELFKNAHDADATKAIVDIRTEHDILVLWDNGNGMTPADVTGKYLTIGTDAKASVAGKAKRTERFNRICMGEKGIGRLAIATLGRQVLMITKSDKSPLYTAVLIHWDLFENGELFLENTVIPVEHLTNAKDLYSRITAMKRELLGNIIRPDGSSTDAWSGKHMELGTRIAQAINAFEINRDALDQYFERLQRRPGTLFYVAGLKEDWAALVSRASLVPGPIQKKRETLGRVMSMFRDDFHMFEASTASSPQATAVNDEDEESDRFQAQLLVNQLEVLEPERFSAADLTRYDYGLDGKIVNGRFEGKALFLGREPEEVSWSVTAGLFTPEESDCGEFSLQVYFVEGDAKKSRLPRDVHTQITRKLDIIGGVYVYRDGMRVLPYGTPEFDFLGIEERRTLKAGRWLFSLRRMFGWIQITKEGTPELRDKSSREGLIENKYYHYFRQTLTNLLMIWGKDYLNGEGRRKEHIAAAQQQTQLEKLAKQAQELEKRWQRERNSFLKELKQSVKSGMSALKRAAVDLEAKIDTIPSQEDLFLETLAFIGDTPQTYFDLWDLMYKVEAQYRGLKDEVWNLRSVTRLPTDHRYEHDPEVEEQLADLGFAALAQQDRLQERLMRRWDEALRFLTAEMSAYLGRVSSQVGTSPADTFVAGLRKAVQHAEQGAEEARGKMLIELDRRLGDRMTHYSEKLNALAGECNRLRDDLSKRGQRQVAASFDTLSAEVRGLWELLERFTALIGNEDLRTLALQIQERTMRFPERLSEVREHSSAIINQTAAALSLPLLDALAEPDAPDMELLDVLGQRVRLLTAQLEQYRSLAVTGIAAEVADHEFNYIYGRVMDLFRTATVKPLLIRNDNLKEIHRLFEHLERQHRAMSPLYRRRNSANGWVELRPIADQMANFFQADLSVYKIQVDNQIDPSIKLFETEATLYPVFINLIGNAIYWLMDQPLEKRVIRVRMERECPSLYIEDDGPGIPKAKADKVFELFYTTRDGGRGIGLHLVREVLGARNHSIICVTDDQEKSLKGACFRIDFAGGTVNGGSNQ